MTCTWIGLYTEIHTHEEELLPQQLLLEKKKEVPLTDWPHPFVKYNRLNNNAVIVMKGDIYTK